MEIITAGIDAGSVSTKVVIMGNSKILAYSTFRNHADASDPQKALEATLKSTGMRREEIHYIANRAKNKTGGAHDLKA